MSIFSLQKEDGGLPRLLREGIPIATFEANVPEKQLRSIVETLNSGVAPRTLAGGPDANRPTDLWWDKSEGIIFTQRKGGWYTNQTGGCCCNHPVAEGEFVFHSIPDDLKSELYDVRFAHEVKVIASACDEIFRKHGLPWVVDQKLLGEEAWLHVLIDGEPAILTWENSD